MYEAQVENCYSSSKKANVDSSGLGLNSGDGFLCALTCSSCRDEKPKRDHGSHAFAESKPLHTTAQHDLSSRFRWRGGRAGVVGQMMGKPGYYEVTAYECQAKEGQPSSLPVCRRFTHSSAHMPSLPRGHTTTTTTSTTTTTILIIIDVLLISTNTGVAAHEDRQQPLIKFVYTAPRQVSRNEDC